MIAKVRLLIELVKFEHTVFALPFALISAGVAARGFPSPWQLTWILVAMVGARTSAMAFNRIADFAYDVRNPRTAARPLPSGRLSLFAAWAATALGAALLVLAARMLNPLAFYLSPVALAVIWSYSFTKRFTSLTHILLGVCLAIAPVGAWVAIRGAFALEPIVLGLAVVMWTAGFDIIYACQDVEFDRREKLFSVPARFGISAALAVSNAFHIVMFLALIWFWRIAHMGPAFALGLAVVGGALVYQHAIVKAGDLSRVNEAFFTANGFLSVVLFLSAAADIALRAAPP
jgi:4-hydroxybenzoate polyprenyltransferase